MRQLLVVLFSFALVHRIVLGAPKPSIFSFLSSGANLLKDRIEKSATALGQVMNVGNQATQLGTKLTGKATYMGTSIGKMGVSSATTLGESALNGGVAIANKGLDFINSFGGNIPLLGAKVQLGTGMGKWGLSLGQSLGQNVLDLTNSLGHGGLSAANTAVQLTTGSVGGLASAGFGLGKKGIDAGAKAMTNAIDAGVQSMKEMFGRPSNGAQPVDGATTITSY
uniref:Venom hemolysin-like protein 6 n=1 Tax=Platymeris rhadamanthus TaxID=1134088 RepID=A0A6B9L8V5_PLARH|nr:venom hemolysin-like protein 6 [Platymeris rhadamanthus]